MFLLFELTADILLSTAKSIKNWFMLDYSKDESMTLFYWWLLYTKVYLDFKLSGRHYSYTDKVLSIESMCKVNDTMHTKSSEMHLNSILSKRVQTSVTLRKNGWQTAFIEMCFHVTMSVLNTTNYKITYFLFDQ